MTARYAELAFTDAIKARQADAGSRAAYARREGTSGGASDVLGEAEQAFIAARDSFYMASVNSEGWPYVQHRGGATGFLKVVDPLTLAFADYAGNKQFISVGNADGDDRVSLFLMDYAAQRRLKIMGHARVIERGDPDYPEGLSEIADAGPVERAWTLRVAAFDWNCPKYITPRFTEPEIAPTVNRLVARIRDLEAQLELAAYTKPE